MTHAIALAVALATTACSLRTAGVGGRGAPPDAGDASPDAATTGAGANAGTGGDSAGTGGSTGVGGASAANSVAASSSTAASGGGTLGLCVPLSSEIACNPVTVFGCFGGNVSCDWYYGDDDTVGAGFACFHDGNVTAACEYADPGEHKFCKPGSTHHPYTNLCHEYCCADSDCSSGKCEGKGLFESAPALGLCSCP